MKEFRILEIISKIFSQKNSNETFQQHYSVFYANNNTLPFKKTLA